MGTAPAGAASAGGRRRAAHVVLVDWDGFDPGYLGRVPTPNLDRLAARGVLTVADATYHTVSNPCRASMSTGAYPEVHGNVAYVFDAVSGRAQGQSRFLAAETIAESLAAEGRTVASVQWYMVQDHGVRYGDPEHLYVQPGGGFGQRVDVAIEILNLRPVDSGGQPVTVPRIPDLLAVYSSDLDGLGHQEGPGSSGIGPLLAEHDRQLGRLIQATQDVGIFQDTAFLLTSDHGMTAWNRTLLPQVVEAVQALGHSVEIVPSGSAPAAGTEVVIVPNAVRLGDITLRGTAAGPAARRRIKAALRGLPEISRVLDEPALRALHAGDKLGDLVAEARPPYGFALDPPDGQWRGAHGSLAEAGVPLLLSGAGIRPGLRPRGAGLIDVAPTIAALLGTRPPAHAQGRDLTARP
ncbi:alkaline phosphatase family protein [Nonomuraea sp. PA05]|uniref:alkaline phosphatase family protein n=1 Tax=Nonomuraea sp. PA05 TaxID=2604466 RepID=UPI0016528117|nr:alkaline phosphatase family protein [Nonomuraea sp. PA05]